MARVYFYPMVADLARPDGKVDRVSVDVEANNRPRALEAVRAAVARDYPGRTIEAIAGPLWPGRSPLPAK